MKNICIIIMTVTTLNVICQKHLVGVRGGASWTNITSSNFGGTYNNKTGMVSGLTYDYLFKNNFSIGTELIYNQRGFEGDILYYNYIGNPTDENNTAIAERYQTIYQFDYLSLPIKAGFKVGNSFYGFTTIGVIPSMLLLATNTVPNFDLYKKVYGSEIVAVTNRVSKFDFAGFAEIGGGYKFKNNVWIYTSVAYQHSFTTITNSNYFPNSTIRHNGFTISVGVKFVLTEAEID